MKNKFQLFLLLILNLNCFSQNMAVPYSYNLKDSLNQVLLQNIVPYTLPSYNNESLQNYSDSITQSCNDCGQKSYYAFGNRVQIDIKSNAQYYNNVFGGKLWVFKIKSTSALGLQLYFSKFIIPDRSNLYIYSGDRTQVYGPFTSAENPFDTTKAIQFGVPPIVSNEICIEYFQHDSADFNGRIVLDNIAHIFNLNPIVRSSNSDNTRTASSSNDPALCNKDVACTLGWEKEINSVALIYIYNNQNNMLGTCSGALLNNTAGDGYPYFLTASHCFDEFDPTYDASTWEFVFDYQASYCANNNNVANVPHQWIYGANVLSRDQQTIYQGRLEALNSDYLLLELNTTASIIQQLGICYAGWTSKDPLASPVYINNYGVFHHPRGSTKKATFGSNLSALPSQVGIHSTNDFYIINLNSGTLEPGSSGAPLFNSNHQVIGTNAFIAYPPGSFPDLCDYSAFICAFGRFTRHWVLGQFKQYLDPLNLTDNPNYEGPASYCPYPAGQTVGIGGPVTSGFPTGQFLDAGFKINGKVGTPVICNTNLTLTPLVANHFKIANYSKSAPCSDAWGLGTWQDGCGGKKILGIKYNCYCRYYSYQVDVEELDYNFNTVASGSKVYENKWGMSGAFGYFSYGIVSSVNINLNNFGLTINPGHYYKIGLQTSSGGTWYYSSRIVYVLPHDIIVNNSTISNDIYAANSITLINSTVPLNANKNFAASNLVQIKQNSTLKSGKYYIQNIDCNTFRLNNEDATIPTSNKNVVSNQPYYFENNQLYKYSANINPIKISPNPTSYSSSIIIPIENNSYVSSLLYDVNGKLLFKIIEETINSKGNFEADILTKDLSTGIYFIKTTINDKLYSNKLVVNHE